MLSLIAELCQLVQKHTGRFMRFFFSFLRDSGPGLGPAALLGRPGLVWFDQRARLQKSFQQKNHSNFQNCTDQTINQATLIQSLITRTDSLDTIKSFCVRRRWARLGAQTQHMLMDSQR